MTMSPGLKRETPGPTFSTRAPSSWPWTSGARGRRYHSTRSLPQMPQAMTLSSTSPGPGSGTGASWMRISLLLYQRETFIVLAYFFLFFREW